MLPNGAGPATVVTHRGGTRFAIRIRSHEVLVDQTLKGGGEDTAPTPIELLGAALGSCIAYYINQFLATRDLPTDGLRVEVIQVKESNPSRVERFSMRLVLPAGIPAHLIPVIERVVDTCPAHYTLAHGAKIHLAIEAPAEALATA
jgi:uncharacterized OsmC-like protein